MSSGRLFHRYGPACAKALSPHVLVDLGMIRAREVDERKFRAGMYGWTRDILYWGAEPWTQWKISNKILKTIRSLIGSQCRDCKIGVMWVRLGDNVTMRAAAFWSFCNLDNWLWGRLYKSALPKSSREEINACLWWKCDGMWLLKWRSRDKKKHTGFIDKDFKFQSKTKTIYSSIYILFFKCATVTLW